MTDIDQNSVHGRFRRILNNNSTTPTDVGFLLGSGVREFRNFLLDQAGKVFGDDALDEPTLEDVVQELLLKFESTRLKSFRGQAKLSTYLISCVVYSVRKKFARLTKRNESTRSIEVSNPNDNSLVESSECAGRKTESKDLRHHVIEQIQPFATSFVSSPSFRGRAIGCDPNVTFVEA